MGSRLLPGGMELLGPSIAGKAEQTAVEVRRPLGRRVERVVGLPGERGRESVAAEDDHQGRDQDEDERAAVDPLEPPWDRYGRLEPVEGEGSKPGRDR